MECAAKQPFHAAASEFSEKCSRLTRCGQWWRCRIPRSGLASASRSNPTAFQAVSFQVNRWKTKGQLIIDTMLARAERKDYQSMGDLDSTGAPHAEAVIAGGRCRLLAASAAPTTFSRLRTYRLLAGSALVLLDLFRRHGRWYICCWRGQQVALPAPLGLKAKDRVRS